MKLDEAKFNFNLSVSSYNPNILGISTPSSILLASLQPSRFLKKIKSNNESFVNGDFSPKDGKIFKILNRKGFISLIQLSSMKILRNFSHSGKMIYSASFSDNSLNMISGGDLGKIKLWDISEQKCINTFHAGKDTIRAVSYFPRHNWIIGCSSYDGKIRLFDIRCKKNIISFNFRYPVETFKFFSNQRIIVGIGGNSIKFWDIRTKTILLNRSETSCISTLSSPSQKSIIYSTSGNVVKLIRTLDYNCSLIGRYQKKISTIEFFDCGLFIGFESGQVLIKNRRSLGSSPLKTSNLKKYEKVSSVYVNKKKVFTESFYPPLRIFNKKNFIGLENLVGRNLYYFYRSKSHNHLNFKKESKLIENGNYRKPKLYYSLQDFIKPTHPRVLDHRRKDAFSHYNYKKISHKAGILHDYIFKKFEYFPFKATTLFFENFGFGTIKDKVNSHSKKSINSFFLNESLNMIFFFFKQLFIQNCIEL